MARRAPVTARPQCAFQAVAYDAERGELLLLDQTLIPREEKFLRLAQVDDMVEAIRSLRVRGAPAIGVAAAYGLCAVARHSRALTIQELEAELDAAADRLDATRPTAVNLMHAVARMRREINGGAANARALIAALEKTARQLHGEELAASEQMGKHAFKLFRDGDGVLTHCNTGALAAPGVGTALGTVVYALRNGKRLHVYADETR
ncbi:MAG: S-methyl-5-thioribose-1-phosphate isomerase, partial [Deltaproteobacteria bacterium]|nr:S-methyl-5-thioribose-1-phosphate isomerase [Deltaproteobacteria bacterium]